jgi:hypothetical protein
MRRLIGYIWFPDAQGRSSPKQTLKQSLGDHEQPDRTIVIEPISIIDGLS